MKNLVVIIAIIVASFVFANDASAQVQPIMPLSSTSTSRDRVKIVLVGYRDPIQAQLLISQYMAQNAKWAMIVDSEPDLVYRVTCYTEIGPATYVVDQKARTRNNMLRSADQTISNLIWGSYSRNRYLSMGKQVAANIGRSKLESYAKPENYEIQRLSSSVTIEVIDRRTSRIVSKSIGVNKITIKTLRTYGYEPITVLAEGDLSGVISDQGANLAGAYIDLLQISAFVKATLPENQIIRGE